MSRPLIVPARSPVVRIPALPLTVPSTRMPSLNSPVTPVTANSCSSPVETTLKMLLTDKSSATESDALALTLSWNDTRSLKLAVPPTPRSPATSRLPLRSVKPVTVRPPPTCVSCREELPATTSVWMLPCPRTATFSSNVAPATGMLQHQIREVHQFLRDRRCQCRH